MTFIASGFEIVQSVVICFTSFLQVHLKVASWWLKKKEFVVGCGGGDGCGGGGRNAEEHTGKTCWDRLSWNIKIISSSLTTTISSSLAGKVFSCDILVTLYPTEVHACPVCLTWVLPTVQLKVTDVVLCSWQPTITVGSMFLCFFNYNCLLFFSVYLNVCVLCMCVCRKG